MSKNNMSEKKVCVDKLMKTLHMKGTKYNIGIKFSLYNNQPITHFATLTTITVKDELRALISL